MTGLGVVDMAASLPHYADHLRPIWLALPEERRGIFVARGEAGSIRRLRSRRNLTVVASHGDLASFVSDGRRAAMIEHGAGQSYGADPSDRVARHRCYAGGAGRHGVDVFLHPNEHAAGRDRAAYPQSRVEIVGPLRHATLASIPAAPPGRPVLAFAFHWDCPMCPETRSAWRVYEAAVRVAVASGEFADVLLHAHPRIWPVVARSRAGATLVRDFGEVLARAHVLAADNTTALFDWAALRGPTVVLDAPWYRRHLHHGLRFWSAAGVGPRVSAPGAVVEAALAAVSGPWPGAREALGEVWAPVGAPAEAAAAVLVEVADSPVGVERRAVRGRR